MERPSGEVIGQFYLGSHEARSLKGPATKRASTFGAMEEIWVGQSPDANTMQKDAGIGFITWLDSKRKR